MAVGVDEEAGRHADSGAALAASPDARSPDPRPNGGRGPSEAPRGFIFYELDQSLPEEEVSFRRWCAWRPFRGTGNESQRGRANTPRGPGPSTLLRNIKIPVEYNSSLYSTPTTKYGRTP